MRTRVLKCVSVLGLAGGLGPVGAEQASLPQMTIPRCSKPPLIDGDLSDAAWREAFPIGRFHYLPHNGKVTTAHRAYVMRDREWLYVAFDLAHPASDREPPRFFKHDDYVQREDCVKVSFEPGTEGQMYYHFKLNRINVRQERRLSVEKGSEVHNWNIPWRSDTKESEDGWSAEIALPFCLLVPYGDLQKARLNLVATFFAAIRDPSGVQMGRKRRDISWSPLIGSFHEPRRFGFVRELVNAELRAPFLPHVTQASIGRYTLQSGKYCYDVVAELRSLSGRDGKVRLTVTDRPATGKETKMARQIAVRADSRRTVRIPVPVSSLVKRTAVLEMSDADTGEFWQRIILDETGELDLFSTYIGRTYYTSEEHAVVRCRIGLPAEGLGQVMLVAKDRGGKVVVRESHVSPVTHFRIPITGLTLGVHELTVELRQKAGAPITSQSVTLTKLPPKPGHEWKVDKINKVVLRNGEPFFPVGMIMGGIRPEDEASFKRVAEAGFNSVFHWYSRAEPEEADAYHRVTAKYDLAVVGRPPAYAVHNEVPAYKEFLSGKALEAAQKAVANRWISLCGLKGKLCGGPILRTLSRSAKNRVFEEFFNANLARMERSVGNAVRHSNLMAHNMFDEPQLSIFDQHLTGRRLYRMVHEVDGYRPAVLLYSSHVPPGDEATDWGDVLVTDPYWIPAGYKDRGTPNYVSKITYLTKKRADADLKATWIVPMAERWSAVHKRYILPAEQFCQTYLALIHGAKGIFYFVYPVQHRAVWDALTAVVGQMRVMAPSLVALDVPQEVHYRPGTFDPDKNQFPDVQASLRRRPDGVFLLLAANSQPYTVEAVYAVSCLPKAGTVTRLFASDRYAVKGSVFSDRLEPFGTRAYVLGEAGGAATPVQIDVTMKRGPDASEPVEVEIPRSGRLGKKNVLQNPGFESFTLPQMPDYYKIWKRADTPLVGEKGSPNGLDATCPYEGKHCFRVNRGFHFFISPQHEQPTQYVFSLYLRSDRDDTQLELRSGHLKRKVVTLTREWKRYHTTATIPPACDVHNTIFVIKKAGEGLIWADALQFEQGETPTGYEP